MERDNQWEGTEEWGGRENSKAEILPLNFAWGTGCSYDIVLEPSMCPCMSRDLHREQEKVAEASMCSTDRPAPLPMPGTICPQQRGGGCTDPFKFILPWGSHQGWEWRRENRKRAGCGTEREKGRGKKSNLPEKKWNSYPTVEQRYDHLNFITFFLV